MVFASRTETARLCGTILTANDSSSSIHMTYGVRLMTPFWLGASCCWIGLTWTSLQIRNAPYYTNDG